MSLLCTICARGGSKGVVGKNARDLLGKPVLAWSIQQARETGLFDAIAFSSDSDALLETALKAGADISTPVTSFFIASGNGPFTPGL